MLIDFGEETLSKTTHIHFICLLLRYSRFLCVYAQDHKYNSEEACKAIYHSFCRLGDKSLVAQVMKECCQKYRYQFSQFKVVYSLAKAGRELATDDCRAQVPSGSVSYTDLSVYAKAFQERTERKEAAAR